MRTGRHGIEITWLGPGAVEALVMAAENTPGGLGGSDEPRVTAEDIPLLERDAELPSPELSWPFGLLRGRWR